MGDFIEVRLSNSRDALAVVSAAYLPTLAVELILLLFSGVLGLIVWRMYHVRPDGDAEAVTICAG